MWEASCAESESWRLEEMQSWAQIGGALLSGILTDFIRGEG